MKKGLFLIFIFLSCCVYGQEKKKKVACIGNSVTYGALLPDREQNCYPAELQELLGNAYEVKNFGKSGATLLSKGHRPYIQQQEYKDALEYEADIVIIHLGLNDTDPRSWPNYKDDFFRDYLNLIHSFRLKNSKAEIWICRLTPITYEHARFISGTRDWYAQIQQTIERVSTYANTGLIDLERPLYNRPDLLPDALHPDKEGAKIMARTIYSALTGNYGGLRMAPIYSDRMVLQRDKYLKIQGVANANELITVEIDEQKHTVTTPMNGKWEITLNPLKTGKALTLNIYSPNKSLSYQDVLVGEVWLCSGQSNMAFPLSMDADYEKGANNLNNPNIRLFNMKPRWETNNTEWDLSVMDSVNSLNYYYSPGWKQCSEEAFTDFSAIAYYFGKMLSDSLNVPIGLIHNAIGGSPIEAWIDRRKLEYRFPEIMKNWTQNDFIQDWVRARASHNIKNATNKSQRHPYEPSYLFEAGIIPLTQYPINGVIWYQGESNAHNIEAFEKMFPLFIDSWRKNWENPQLPFYYVQLSSLNRPSWTWFRDSQRKMMNTIPHIYMAVSSDKGDSLDVHPRYKKDIGERLAFWALNKSYGKNSIIPSGPLYRSVEFVKDNAYLTFDYADGLHGKGETEIKGFEIAETEGIYYPAQAKVENGKIRVWSEKVEVPRYVRYGWLPYTNANLTNNAHLPASTFRTENQNTLDMNEIPLCKSLPDYPIQGGVSAPFTGILNDRLIVAGGCNFPNSPASEGGKKEFYDDIFYMDISEENQENSQWIKAGTLPYKAAYGVSVPTKEGIICIGGQNNQKAIENVIRIKFDGNTQKVSVEELPPLPAALYNAGAVIIENTIYVTGGISSEKKLNYIYCLNLENSKDGWKKIRTNQKQERQQPVVFTQDNYLFMAGGYDEKNAKVFSDVLKFNFSDNKWYDFSEITVNGQTATFIGSGSVTTDPETTWFIGGVDYNRFLSAITRIKKRQEAISAGNNELADILHKEGKEYMSQPIAWYKFNPVLLSFNTKNKEWKSLSVYPQLARAGSGIAVRGNELFIIGGEVKPGVRTAEVNKVYIK